MYGGFTSGQTNLGDRNPNPATNGTVLSGEIGAAGIADNSHTIVIGSGTDNTAILDGFTISGGNADEDFGFPSLGARGGGMYINEGSPTVSNCLFTENFGAFGGGLYILNDLSLTLNNCSFLNNTGSYGGGIYSEGENANPTLQNCTFESNTATIVGGAVYGISSISIIDCQINGNQAESVAGVFVSNGVLEMTNTVVSNNNATTFSGGIWVQLSPGSTITNCLITDNTSQDDNGAIGNASAPNQSSLLTLVNSTIANNSSVAPNGAV